MFSCASFCLAIDFWKRYKEPPVASVIVMLIFYGIKNLVNIMVAILPNSAINLMRI
jgi:hypothetical protein